MCTVHRTYRAMRTKLDLQILQVVSCNDLLDLLTFPSAEEQMTTQRFHYLHVQCILMMIAVHESTLLKTDAIFYV